MKSTKSKLGLKEESKGLSWKIRRFLCCHMVLVRATHHPHHELWFISAPNPSQNWRKWFTGEAGRGPTAWIHLMDSHHRPTILLQLKKRCPTSSCSWPQRRQAVSWMITLLLMRLALVESLSLRSLQVKTADLGGIFIFQINIEVLTSEAGVEGFINSL